MTGGAKREEDTEVEKMKEKAENAKRAEAAEGHGRKDQKVLGGQRRLVGDRGAMGTRKQRGHKWQAGQIEEARVERAGSGQ